MPPQINIDNVPGPKSGILKQQKVFLLDERHYVTFLYYIFKNKLPFFVKCFNI